MTEKTKQIIKLHEQGKSTREIADIYKMRKNSIIGLLRNHDKLRPSPGIETEENVCNWLKKKGHKVKRMRGDWYYDCLVNGKKVDIKYSSLNESDKRYIFEINHRQSLSKNNHRIDYYFLVMDDGIDKNIYRLKAKHTLHLKYCLAIGLKHTKYPIELMGKL